MNKVDISNVRMCIDCHKKYRGGTPCTVSSRKDCEVLDTYLENNPEEEVIVKDDKPELIKYLEAQKIFEKEKLVKFTDASMTGKCAMSRIHLIEQIIKHINDTGLTDPTA